MSLPLIIPERVVATSLEALQRAGHAGNECVVLWLGQRTAASIDVVETYVPHQIASGDFFRLPRESIAALFDVLRQRGLMVAAQLHTHPERAFHSVADDTWAIVRHVGALSLVLPYFGQRTTTETFWTDVATFRLSPANVWQLVDPPQVHRFLRADP